MLKSVQFRAGSTPKSEEATRVEVGDVLILVGPNNSGKSLALREIYGKGDSVVCEHELRGSGSSLDDWTQSLFHTRKPIDPAFEAFGVSQEDLLPILGIWEAPSIDGVVGGGAVRFTAPSFLESLTPMSESNQIEAARSKLVQLFVGLSTAGERTRILQRARSSDLAGRSTSMLHRLFTQSEPMQRLRSAFHDAFGVWLYVSAIDMQQFEIVAADSPMSQTMDPHSLGNETREFFADCSSLTEYSDGTQAYADLLALLLTSHLRLFLLDEPEAFLHPPLARKLGGHVGDITKGNDRTVVAATHSPDFVFGCLESSANVTVVRLTWDGKMATARAMDEDTLRRFMREPMLRSSNVLSALFHNGVVVTEGDSDRAFYQEISYRLNQQGGEGVRDSLFINAHGKHDVHKIAGPLRQLGIPAAVILDLDAVVGSGGPLKGILDSIDAPPTIVASINAMRGELNKSSVAKEEVKRRGLEVYSGAVREGADKLLEDLAIYGIFVVPTGEVESWLPDLDVSRKKNKFLSDIFEAMGSDPEADGYVEPEEGDVWDFMRAVADWIDDPGRKGIPG